MWSKVSCLTRKKNNADVQVPTPKDKYTTVPLGRKTLVGHFLSHPIYTSIHPTEKTLLGKKYKSLTMRSNGTLGSIKTCLYS